MHRSLFLFSLFLFSVFLFAQKGKQGQRVKFDANSMQMDKDIAPDARRLIGNVSFRHEGAVMYCDSAYFYSERNSLDAYGNVVVNRGDTIFLYAEELFYNGNSKQIKGLYNVRLVDDSTVLYTDTLYYNMHTDIGFFPDDGTIINENDTLNSIRGTYYSRENLFLFQDSVEVRTPKYRIYSDTLQYHTNKKKVLFSGPTRMYGDSSYIYCEQGIYYTDVDIAELSVHASLLYKTNSVHADSIYYSKPEDYAETFHSVEIADTVENITIYGNYGKFYLSTEDGFVTDSALLVRIAEDGDSVFVHADTLFSLQDSLKNRMFKAYYYVKIYNQTFQAKCDSMVYLSVDSTIHLYIDPIMWVEENQMTADEIVLYAKHQGIDSVWMKKNAFIVDHEVDDYFNQIKGRDMMNYFRDNALYAIHVMGNAETVYFPKDEETAIIEGMNTAESKEMFIFIEDGKIKNIKFDNKPKGTMFPLEDIPEEKIFLRGFIWLNQYRPNTFEEVFIK